MRRSRRRFLGSAAGLGVLAAARPLRAAASGRVAIVGGGWGGLAAARTLRQIAPALDVVLVERERTLRGLPMSNHWLAGLDGAGLATLDYGAAAARLGYRYMEASVSAVDRDARIVVSSAGRLPYDWLVLAVGIRNDYSTWFGDDARAAALAGSQWPGGFVAAELAQVKRIVNDFRGGNLLMTVPPMPYRCPPAPYERAVALALLMERRQLAGRVVVLDPNPGMPVFQRVFDGPLRDRVVYRPHTRQLTVDGAARTVTTEVESFRFAAALLAPAQRAADLIARAGLVASGSGAAWADVDPLSLRSRADERVFVIGDAVGPVSPLFGHFPKTAHLASRMGDLVAARIAALAAGREPEAALPAGNCLVFTSLAPPEALRIDTRYRVRADGVLEQVTAQARINQPGADETGWVAQALAGLGGMR